ncbi:hypothetical protein [Nonomuraea lactucae]|uniref:hypothetical protein n=1 Tax=Nonomuraea lactucae TaxID=2249762 RepID=UPI001F058810|nr:hypothetical protein [Nonomuraea lactucae]
MLREDVTIGREVRNNPHHETEEPAVRITFVGKDPESNPTGSPTIYRTDRQSWLVQGWEVTNEEALSQMDIPEGETVVEIPDRMLQFFKQAGA